MEINILIDKEYKPQLKSKRLKNVISQILNAENVSVKSEMSLVITGDDKIHELNMKYLEENSPTDVLSFPMNEQIREQPAFISVPDGKLHLGEVIISYPQAVKQAEEHSHPVHCEVTILLIHGVLHLLGYDHDTPERGHVMRSKESIIFKIIEEKDL